MKSIDWLILVFLCKFFLFLRILIAQDKLTQNKSNIDPVYLLTTSSLSQPRSQGLSLPAPQSERRETLVGSGHVPPRIWGVTKKSLMGGAA